jgi:hypothetical protein
VDPNAHLCSAPHTVCANTPGSYECACAANYQLDPASRNCQPVNPCTGSPCHAEATCRYMGPGRYNCSCKTGYAGDGKECKRKNFFFYHVKIILHGEELLSKLN